MIENDEQWAEQNQLESMSTDLNCGLPLWSTHIAIEIHQFQYEMYHKRA